MLGKAAPMLAQSQEEISAATDSVPYMIQAFARLLATDYMGRIAKCNITLAQARIIMILDSDIPLSQIELSRMLDIGRASIGQTLAVLESRGVVQRVRNDADRRVITIRLTEEGKMLPGPLRVAAKEQASALGEFLGLELTAQLHKTLAKALDFAPPVAVHASSPFCEDAQGGFPATTSKLKSDVTVQPGILYLVQRVQIALQSYGYYQGLPDGIVGARTRRALRNFQVDYGLKATGTITPEVMLQLQIKTR